MGPGTNRSKRKIARRALALLAVALVALVLLFDWNWLRGPIERYVLKKTGRRLTIVGNIDGAFLPPTLRLGQIRFENAPWSKEPQMAAIERLEFRPRIWPLLRGELVADRVRAESPDVLLERTADGKRNWVFGKSDDPEAKAPEITSLAIDRGIIRVRDELADVVARIQLATEVQASGNDAALRTRVEFSGSYFKVPFDGDARVGELLELKHAGKPFPVRGKARFGATQLEFDGTATDLLGIDGIDARVKVAGPDWSQLFPVIPVVLPRSPPYVLDGRLRSHGDRHAYQGFKGRIGDSDLSGSAIFTAASEKRRAHLSAEFHSSVLDLKDLGPMVGLRPALPSAASTARVGKVLPDLPFRVERFKVMDADVTLRAKQIRRPQGLALEDLNARLKLVDSVLELDPLDFGFAGGNIVSIIRLDAQQDPIATQAKISLRAVKLDKLFPAAELMNKSQGVMGAMIRLSGRGNSVAHMLATANGEAGFAVSEGVLSNLLIEFVGLDGGEIVKFLVAGDRTTRVRCGAALFEVTDGIGTARAFVFDTEDTKIEGRGDINFRDETLDLRLKPHPKDRRILVLRSPLRVTGSFASPRFSVKKSGLLKRAGTAILLGVVNPVASLLALIETGTGKDADCAEVLGSVGSAVREAKKPVKRDRVRGLDSKAPARSEEKQRK